MGARYDRRCTHRAVTQGSLARISRRQQHQHRRRHHRQPDDVKCSPLCPASGGGSASKKGAQAPVDEPRQTAAGRNSRLRIAPSCMPVATQMVRRTVRRRQLFYAEVIACAMAASSVGPFTMHARRHAPENNTRRETIGNAHRERSGRGAGQGQHGPYPHQRRPRCPAWLENVPISNVMVPNADGCHSSGRKLSGRARAISST